MPPAPKFKPHPLAPLTDDAYLKPYWSTIRRRLDHMMAMEHRLTGGGMSIADFASGHTYYGLHRTSDGWVFREWAPNARTMHLVGTFTQWRDSDSFMMERINDSGTWEIRLPHEALHHGDLYRLHLRWPGGEGDRIPAYARRVVQDDSTKIFNAQVWHPETPYEWKHTFSPEAVPLLIYEAHVGMAQEKTGIGTYDEFRTKTLPRIIDAGYNAIQLMAIMEHPYYGSFGYHVSSFFAASSRFGTPDELKHLIDDAHAAGIRIIMDLIHSHAVMNEVEGISKFDGTEYQYFHAGPRGHHDAWDSRCFNYGKPEVLHFLLSNCRFWLDEYRIDGFRFDGVTSMLYYHHGLAPPPSSYDYYFGSTVDEDALAYLGLANKVIHTVRPDAVTIAEDVSGMPGLGVPVTKGGFGFDCRLAMGIPDCWFKLIREVSDDNWNMGYIWHELTNRRADERTISYTECHDQSIVGGKTVIFQLIDEAMYRFMRVSDQHLAIDRGMALHKLLRLATLSTAADGYLNFIGNEFGHPEWVDFPREGNGWSYHYARRQWSLRDDPNLKYRFLADFDRAMISLARANNLVGSTFPHLLAIREEDKVLWFERAGILFLFNFHPTRSLPDYEIPVPVPGEYKLLLDTDHQVFGGSGRVHATQHYLASPTRVKKELVHSIKVYIPCRSALVLTRIANPSTPGASLPPPSRQNR